MKILYCYRYGILGGVSTQLLNRIRVLSNDDQRIEAHLLFGKDYGISTTLAGYPHLVFERDMKRSADYARDGGFDAIVVIDSPEYLDAFRELHVPIVIEVHTTVEQGLRYLGEKRRRPVGFVVPSQFSRHLLEDRFGYGVDEPIEVVPNSLDPRLFPRLDVSPVPQWPVFAWVGKLDDHKNWRGFLEVASRISSQSSQAEFWLVGGETAPAAVEEEMIDELARRDLTSRARWLPRVEYGAMHRLYAAVRQSGGSVVATTIAESFGMSILEALLCGCPVVAPRVGGIPEIAPDKGYLRLYELGDAVNAAELAVEIATPEVGDPIRTQLHRDRTWLEGRFATEVVARRYRTILLDLVAGAAPRAGSEAGSMEVPRNGPTMPGANDLVRAVERLRRHVPNYDEYPDDPVAFLDAVSGILELRSFRLARVVAARKGGLRFWLRFPWALLRLWLSRASTRSSSA